MSVVLVVEDEAHILILAESVLNDAGYETLAASSLSAALAIIEDPKQKFDLLCADLGLQDSSEDGLKIAEVAAKARPGLPVVYITGRGVTGGMVNKFVQPNRFVPKPYTSDRLLTAVAELLQSTPARRSA